MNMLVVILVVLALLMAALHTVLWHTVATYRNPLLLHLAVIVGFIGVLLGALGVGS